MEKSILLLTLCIVPSLIIMWYIYIKDKVEKEPPFLLLILFIGGIISAITSSFISTTLKVYLPFLNYNYINMNIIQILFKSLIVIAFIEEGSKWIINYLFIWKNKNFNHIYDPIVYSVFIALGFATFENILYGYAFSSYGFIPVFLRGIISVPCHAVFGIFMGYYLGISKKAALSNALVKARNYKLLSCLIPILLHFIYDLLLINLNKVTYIIFIIYIIILYILSYSKIKKTSTIKKMLN